MKNNKKTIILNIIILALLYLNFNYINAAEEEFTEQEVNNSIWEITNNIDNSPVYSEEATPDLNSASELPGLNSAGPSVINTTNVNSSWSISSGTPKLPKTWAEQYLLIIFSLILVGLIYYKKRAKQ